MRLHVFNPDNDLALATGLLNYTAPAAAQRLRSAGAMLPVWYAEADDAIWVPKPDYAWIHNIKEKFGLNFSIIKDQAETAISSCLPWGWSLSIWSELQRLGISADVMPNTVQLDKMRLLSHRRSAMQLSNYLKEKLPKISFTPTAVEVFTLDELGKQLNEIGPALLKQPWSSSGRGIANTTKVSRDVIMKWAYDSLRLQGSVMVEPLHDVACDFAAIWKCEGGKCESEDLSVFHTDSNGNYKGNLLASEEIRKEKINLCYPIPELEIVLGCMQTWIEEEISPYYEGILGVDMLVTKSGILDAAVEINLRKTMGWVANEFYKKFMNPENVGYFSANRLGKGTKSCVDSSIVENGKLINGNLPLVPSNPYFEFVASIES